MRAPISAVLAITLLAAAPAGAGQAGVRETSKYGRKAVDDFYRRFAPKALEAEAWSRGLRGKQLESFVSNALKPGALPGGARFPKPRPGAVRPVQKPTAMTACASCTSPPPHRPASVHTEAPAPKTRPPANPTHRVRAESTPRARVAG
jgi:hypothetical protein